jgi:hypothetical protein
MKRLLCLLLLLSPQRRRQYVRTADVIEVANLDQTDFNEKRL